MLGAVKKWVFAPHRETVHIRAAMHSLLQAVPEAHTLLDVGCGDGHATQRYATIWNIPSENIVGVRAALEERADYVLLVNDDTEVSPDFLKALVEQGEEQERGAYWDPGSTMPMIRDGCVSRALSLTPNSARSRHRVPGKWTREGRWGLSSRIGSPAAAC